MSDNPTLLLYDTYYHIYQRGRDRDDIFIEERNYEFFLSMYFKYIEPIAETFAYCMLPNHYHMLVRVKPQKEIEAFLRFSETNRPLDAEYAGRKFSELHLAYSRTIRDAYGKSENLFQDELGYIPVETEGFQKVISGIHQNPQKHQLVKDFRDWKHSSYDLIPSDDPTKIRRETVLEWFGGRKEYLKFHKEASADGDNSWFVDDHD